MRSLATSAAAAALLLLCAAGYTAAQAPVDELAPAGVSPTGAKYWKSPLLAARANNFTAFASKVADLGLASTLGADNLTATIFAPTDAAFKNLTDSTDPAVQSILDSKDTLKAVFTYHVVPGATLTVARIKDLVSKAPNKTRSFTTLQGDKIVATLDGSKLLINGVAVGTPVDVQGGKTMLIALDKVVVPPSISGVAPKGMAASDAAAAAAVKAAMVSGARTVTAAAALLAAPVLLAALL